jgi:mRNA interferase MazF
MKRGEVWLINLDPTSGAEIHKTRPCVIVSSDLMGALPLRIVVPLTAWREAFRSAPWQVRIKKTAENGLDKTSSADTFQVRSVSERRLVRRLGRLAPVEMDHIAHGLAISLGLS